MIERLKLVEYLELAELLGGELGAELARMRQTERDRYPPELSLRVAAFDLFFKWENASALSPERSRIFAYI